MATTYTLISSNVLTSSAAYVSFTSIPQTYTDLILNASIRSSSSGAAIGFTIQYNTYDPAYLSNTNYSRIRLLGNGSAASSAAMADREAMFVGEVNASTSTSDTFSSYEMYIPNYTNSSSMQPASGFMCQENNNATAFINATALLYDQNTAISSIYLFDNAGANIVSGSSFYLYGISNA